MALPRAFRQRPTSYTRPHAQRRLVPRRQSHIRRQAKSNPGKAAMRGNREPLSSSRAKTSASGPTSSDAVAVVYHSWTTSRHHIKSVDAANHIVHFTAPSSWPMGYWDKNERYYIEGIREALDAPGEFHLDRKTGRFDVLSITRRGHERGQVRGAPWPRNCWSSPATRPPVRCVEYLRFEGISFQHTGWVMPQAATVDGQANAGLPHATVRAAGLKNSLFERCEIAHTGSYAIWLQNGCKGQPHRAMLHPRYGRRRRPSWRNGACPIKKELQAERNEVYNCFINDGGNVYHAGIGVWIGKSSHNKVHHCDNQRTFSTRVYRWVGAGAIGLRRHTTT